MTWKSLAQKIIKCEQCPWLRQYCCGIAEKKKPEFQDFTYWGKPVPGFGDPEAALWIVGLAPGAHGANRTGRMFTGDSSGDWLYSALNRFDFANQALSKSREDGLRLKGVFISAAARCAPPKNRPTVEELQTCSVFLDEEYRLLQNKRVFLGLGKIGFESILKLLKRQGITLPSPIPKFLHGAIYEIHDYKLVASYHPSRQNTNTGVLTKNMWEEIFRKTKALTEA